MSASGDQRRGPSDVVVGIVAVLIALVLIAVLGDREDDAGVNEEPAAADGPVLVPATPPSAPVRLPDPGAYVDARVQPDGTVEVTHWLRPAEGVDELTLAAYPTLQVSGPPSVTDLGIRTSLGEVQLPDEPEIGTTPVTVPLVRSSLLVVLTYTLRGVTDTDGTEPGRALVGSVYADVDHAAEEGGTRVQIGGRRILSTSCFPDPSLLTQVACGTPREGGWAVNFSSRQLDQKVLAQVDLDRRQKRNPDAGINLG